MTGVIYARYSSDNQREESIEGQLRENKAFAEKNGIKIVETYIDRALSAKTDNRPEFQRMIKDSSRKAFDVVIVWKLDRFSRNRYDSAKYKAILKRNGVKVVSATETISDGAEGIILESVLEAIAEYYSADLAEKVGRGLTENALKCKFNGGTIPVGYVIDEEQHFQIDPLTAPFVVQAFERYANGDTMKAVTDFLNKSGIRTTRGTEISVNSTTRMLHNRRYIGEYTFRDITVKDGISAIITKELFDRVQARMERTKKAPSQHKAEDDYILTTKLRCGKCKCFMIGESGTSHTEKTVHHYYKCVSVKKHRGCDKKTVRKSWIEDLVINKVKELIMDDDLINRICDMVVEELGKESSALPILKKQLKDVEKGINNMLDAIQSGIKTPSIKQRAEELENRKEELSILILQEEMKKPIISRDLIEAWIKHFRKYDISKLEERQRLVDHFVNVIYLYEDHFDLFLNFREGAVTITFDENMLKAAKSRKSKKTNISSDLTPSTAPEKSSLRRGFFNEVAPCGANEGMKTLH